MIERIIYFSIKNKFIIGLFVAALVLWGTYSLTQLPIDAIPDITNNQVQIISISPSMATQEVESFITAPIEVAVANIPDIVELRSISRLGLSVVTVVFKENVDIYWARQQLTERLKEAEESIPEGVAKIELAPVSTGLGEIFQYHLKVKEGYESRFDPMELRTLQDWIVRREMLGTPGVADINSYGGFVKQYEVAVNPELLRGMNLSLTEVFDALEKNNENTGSAYIDKKPNAYFIRGIGLVRSLEDIEKIVIKHSNSGFPILIRDIAKVQYGNATRYGAFVVDTAEAVGGVVMMLKGENAHKVIDNVQKRIASIQKSLPEGVTIEPFLNRSDLVGRAIGTVSKNLIEGALIVIFILVLFLGNIRAGLIVASVIPLSMLFAISVMKIVGVSGNLMSLGAIDFGLIVDGAVIIVESAVHKLFSFKKDNISARSSYANETDENVFQAAKRMMSSATFGQVIILVVYIPIIALVGIEGKMFRPMAQVVILALTGAAILSLTWVPMASALFLRKQNEKKTGLSEKMMEKIHRGFDPLFKSALKHKSVFTSTAVFLFVLSIFIFTRLGGEFIPQLEEGDLAAGIMTLQGGSLSYTKETVIKANKILLENFPEVKHAVCKIGAGEIPTDPTPIETGDYIITLKDKSEWTSASSREELVALMEEKLIPLAGVKFEFQQPIQMRFNELISGSRQDVAVKIFGDDLQMLAEKASEVEKLITDIKGVQDVNVEKVTGLSQIQIEMNRDRLAEYGLSVNEVNKVIKAAFAGSQAGVVFDEEKRFGLVVRLDKDYRQNLEDVENLMISRPGGGQIPINNIADIKLKSGPAQVSRENTKRRITIGFNVRNRDVQSVISEVSDKIDKNMNFPTGYYVAYGGQFQNFEAARARLSVAVPVALLLIFILLYFTFKSVSQALLIFTAVPMAAIGGIFALWIRGMNFSISAGVGFIALFGVAVLNGIVLIAEFNRLASEGITDISERVLKGLHSRLRPVIMTASVASLGFLPMALSVSAGAEVQKPLATVVIGGLITATILTLFILPVFYVFFTDRKAKPVFKRKPFISFFLAVILFAGNSALHGLNAQEPERLTLKEAIDQALENNLKIKSSALSVEAQRALKQASLDLNKTNLDFEYGQINSPARDNNFSISQSVSFPSLYINQHKLATSKTKSSELQFMETQLEVATSVKQVWWKLAYLQSKRRLIVYQDSLYDRFLKAAELRAKTGETNKLEMITARSQSLEIKNQLNEVNSDIIISTRILQNILNAEKLFLPSDTILTKAVTIRGFDSAGLKLNPSLGYFKQQVEIAQREKALEISKVMPEVNIGFFSQTMRGIQEPGGSSRVPGPDDRFSGFRAGLSVPLWIFPYTSKAKAARINENIAASNAEYYSDYLETSYKTLMDEYEKYSKSVIFFEKQAIPEAELIIEQSSRSYRAGALDYLEYVLSLNRALEIKQNYLEALNHLNQTIVNIEFITGKIY